MKHKPWSDKRVIKTTKRYAAGNYARFPEFVLRTMRGPYMRDKKGHRVLNGLAGYGALIKGANWKLARKAERRAGKHNRPDLPTNNLYTEEFARFCEAICRFTGFDQALPKSDGASATTSVRTAFREHAKMRGIEEPEMLVREHAFHGRGDHDQLNYNDKETKGPKYVVVPDDFEAIKQAINKNTIGVLWEEPRGEGGPLFDKKDLYVALWTHLKDLEAQGQKVFLIKDDIQAGFYRCGYRFSHWKWGIGRYEPDGMTLGKALSGGRRPISVFVGTRELMSVFRPGTDGSTFGGSPPSCVVATAVIEYLEKHPLGERARQIGARFAENLKDIPHVRVEYEGALIGIRVHGVRSLTSFCHALLLGRFGHRVFLKEGHVYGDVAHLRVSPTMDITDRQIDKMCKPIRRGLMAISEMIDYAIGSGTRLPIELSF